MTTTSSTPNAPTSSSILAALPLPRILDLARLFGVRLRAASTPKPRLAAMLGAKLEGRAPLVLRELGRDELQAVCRAHGIPDHAASRRDLLERLLLAAGFDPKRSAPPLPSHHREGLPRAGQVVRARHRQWLVEEVPLVKLVCLDDDDPGTVIPELEDVGQRLYDARAAYMVETQQGLTQTYNKLKDPGCQDEAVVLLRRLHEEMDRAVLAAYGWSDLQVPPFCPSTAEEQSALEAFQDQVIDRLFVLNAERAAEEQRLGSAKPAKPGKAVGPKKKREPSDRSGGEGELF